MSLIRYRRNAGLPTYRWFTDGGRDPFQDEFFRRFFGDIGSKDQQAVLSPAVDITEDDGTYTVSAELPGLSREDVDVQVHEGVLTIKAERREESEETRGNVHVSERSYGTYQRSFRLPEEADLEGIAATMKDGILTLTIPRVEVEEEKPRQIEIQA